MKLLMKNIFSKIIFSTMFLVIAGCATTEQVPNVRQSGFLGDYSKLHKGRSGQAEFVYRDLNADFGKYQKIIIDPVQIWVAQDEDSALGKLPREDQQLLVDYLFVALIDSLKRDYVIVDQPGPDVIRMRCAITEAKAESPVRDLVSTVCPYGLGISYAKRIVTGTHSAVGVVSIEGEVVDSVTGQRLGAVMDRRAGTKSISGKFTRWGDVQDAFNFWARRIQTNLALLRAHQV